MEPDILICTCNSTEHQIIVQYDDEDKIVYCNMHLVKFSFWERLVLGVKYIFGYNCKYGHWDEFIFDKTHIKPLTKIIEHLKNDIKNS